MRRSLLFLLLAVALVPAFAFGFKKSKQKNVSAVVRRHELTAEQTLLFDSLYFEALSKDMQGDVQSSLEFVDRALLVDSLSAPALFLRSRLYRITKNPLSLHDIEKAAEIDSTNFWYGMSLGDAYLERNRFDLAIPCMERLSRQHPEKSDPLFTLAELYMRIDSLERCLNVLDRIETMEGMNPNMTMQKFYILQQLGRPDDAFAEYDKLIRRYPYDISYRIRLGDLQMRSGMIPKAKETYDEAARIDPDNAYLWIAMSDYYSITGNQSAADSLVHNALLNANLDIDTKISILTEYLKTTLRKVSQEKQTTNDTTAIDLPGVDSLFLTIEMMHPTSPEVYNLHADYLGAIDQDSLAAVQMRFAADLKPSEQKYWSKLLSYLAQSRNYLMILATAADVKRIHPSLPDIYLTSAFAYANLDQNDEVIACYEEGLKQIDHNNASLISNLYGYLGDAYHQAGVTEKAYENYDLALKYNERNFSVLNNYAYFLTLDGGDLNKAEKMAAKVVQEYPDEPTYLDTYAWIYYLQGNYMLANFYQTKAIEKAGDNPSADLVMHYEAILKAIDNDK